ncbi:MAG TPA: PaaI family thioesterase [Thermoleophilaceae bacterium]|jgi:uncharacterized protein (TIGR00369 family)
MPERVKGETRTRTVSWEDPAPSVPRLIEMTGLEAMQAVVSGDLPSSPFVEVIGIRAIEAEEGRVTMAVRTEDYHANPAGGVHGGLAAALLDSAMWSAVLTTMPQGTFCTTLQMNVNYVRPIPMDDEEVRAEAHVVHGGRRTATAEGSIHDSNGKLCAHGTATCVVVGGS